MGEGRYQGGGLLTTSPIVNGLIVNSSVKDPFAYFLVLGRN